MWVSKSIQVGLTIKNHTFLVVKSCASTVTYSARYGEVLGRFGWMSKVSMAKNNECSQNSKIHFGRWDQTQCFGPKCGFRLSEFPGTCEPRFVRLDQTALMRSRRTTWQVWFWTRDCDELSQICPQIRDLPNPFESQMTVYMGGTTAARHTSGEGANYTELWRYFIVLASRLILVRFVARGKCGCVFAAERDVFRRASVLVSSKFRDF